MPTQQEIITACFTPLLANPKKGEKGKAPGILVGVTDNGVHSYYKFGYVPMMTSNDTINTEDIVMFIGSNTKVVTATLLALACYGQTQVTLANKVTVNGDTVISSLLPTGVKYYYYSSEKPIRLWHLATHSAGYPDGPCPQNSVWGAYTFPQTSDFLGNFTPPYIPGLYWHYSNQGFALLGALMSYAFSTTSATPPSEWLTGYQRWPTVANNQVLTPLNMSSTQVGYNTGDPSNLAQSFGFSDNNKYPAIPTPKVDPGSAAVGAGALTSTLSDMLTFLDNQIKPPSGTTRLDLLGKAITLTQQPQGNADLSMGMAWQIGNDYFEKNGLAVGYATYMAFDPAKGYGIFAMANSWGNDYGGTLTNTGRKALGELRSKGTTPPKFNTTTTIPACPTSSGGQG